MGKTDSTGTYSYVCDGTTPGSSVLSDGHALYTPGLSENRGGTSAYYSNDRLGNLWTLNGSTRSQLTYEDFSGFGGVTAGASGGTPFGFGGGNGCQTDADTGLVLMGHRYYDTRIGRFISQDPAGAGGNWYEYAGNSPNNATDPDGLDYIDSSRVPSDWQQQTLANDASYNGQDVSWDSSGVLHWSDGSNDHSYILNDMSGGAGWSADSWIAGGTGAASLGDGLAIGTGFGSWVDEQGTFGLASAAGKAWGDVDSGHGSRAGAIGLSAAAAGAVVVTAVTFGEDTAAVDGAKAFAKSLSGIPQKVMFKGNAIDDVARLVSQYGGKAKNWEKVKGWMPNPEYGADVEIHWYQNMADNLSRQEPKTKLPWNHPAVQMQP